MDWKQAAVGVRVSFPAFRYKHASNASQTRATIVGIEKKSGSKGQDTICLLKLDDGKQIACKVSDLTLGTVNPK